MFPDLAETPSSMTVTYIILNKKNLKNQVNVEPFTIPIIKNQLSDNLLHLALVNGVCL